MGNREESLVRRFEAANLRATVAERTLRQRATPNGLNSIDIFAMGIRGRPKKDRHFSIFPGAPENRVEVQGVDKDLRQLVLMVHEPVRTFTENVPKHRAKINPAEVKVVSETNYYWVVERKTDNRKRHFLCGTDERDYFVAQLPRPVSTVRAAHEVLRPQNAKSAVARQGEWFFLEPSRNEKAELEALEEVGKLILYRKMPIGPSYQGRFQQRQFGGNPHTADELTYLGIPRIDQTAHQTFIRGKVRHVDHETKEFYSWVKVVRNTERVDNTGVARMYGVTWID